MPILIKIIIFVFFIIKIGYVLENPHEYAKRFFKLFNGAMGISKDAAVEDVEVGADDEEEEESFNFFLFKGFYFNYNRKRTRRAKRRRSCS